RSFWPVALLAAVGLSAAIGSARAERPAQATKAAPEKGSDPLNSRGLTPFREEKGIEVLARGPIHEAFTQAALTKPEPGPVVPKKPPDPIKEVPPEVKPKGKNVQWLPGYWAWDPDKKDSVWVSGCW